MDTAPGERVIWKSRAGGTTGYSQLAVTGVVLYLLFGGGCSCFSVPIVLATTPAEDLVSRLPMLAMSLVMSTPTVLLLVWWAVPRLRTSLFLTDRALLSRRLLGGYDRIELESLTAAEPYVKTYYGRYGRRQDVHTHRLELHTNGQVKLFGPSKDVDRLLELVQGGVLSRWFDLGMLPSLDGLPAPAEQRTDLFLCGRTRSEGFDYGPLFVGPTVIVRFTDGLPSFLLGRLYTVAGEASSALEAEREILTLLENPDAGHYTRLPREGTGTQLEGGRLRLSHEEATHEVELGPADAERFAGYLKVTTRGPGGR